MAQREQMTLNIHSMLYIMLYIHRFK